MKKTAVTMALTIAAAASLLMADGAAAYHRHGRSGYDASPAYWGVERRVHAYRDCTGWCRPRQSPAAASVHQLDPRLRARRSGRLLEEVGTPPPPSPDVAVILPNSSGPAVTFLPRGFWNGHFWKGNAPAFWYGSGRGYRFTRGR